MPRKKRRVGLNAWLLGGGMLAGLALLIDPGWFSVVRSNLRLGGPVPEPCQERVQPESVLSRAELSQLLAIPERSPKSKVKAIVQEPYCKLATTEVRAGVEADREAYPLEFDLQVWLIVLYEGDEYAGYAFSFRH